MDIRILSVNNPLTALFMGTFIGQRKSETADCCSNYILFSPQGGGNDAGELTYREECLLPFKGIPHEVIVLPGEKRKTRDFFSTRTLIEERRRRKHEIGAIGAIFNGNGIRPENVKEIWYGNSYYNPVLLHLCGKAGKYEFEHGIHETQVFMDPGFVPAKAGKLASWNPMAREAVRKVRNAVEAAVERSFLFYSSRNVDAYDNAVSLLGDEIRKANSSGKIATLDAGRLWSAIDSFKEHICGGMDSSGNCALIMLDVLEGIKEEDLIRDYFMAFEEYLLEKCERVFRDNGITRLIFKPRISQEEQARMGLASFRGINRKYETIFLPDVSPHNYPAEYYACLRPRAIIANHSSALFYYKKLLPEIRSYSCDEWYCQYCRNVLGEDSDKFRWYEYEISWQKEFFHRLHREEFKDVLPVKL